MELVEVSQLSSYQPLKPFLLFGHGSKPQFQSIPGYIGSGMPETKDFFEILDNPDRLQAMEVIQKNCYQLIILVT